MTTYFLTAITINDATSTKNTIEVSVEAQDEFGQFFEVSTEPWPAPRLGRVVVGLKRPSLWSFTKLVSLELNLFTTSCDYQHMIFDSE